MAETDRGMFPNTKISPFLRSLSERRPAPRLGESRQIDLCGFRGGLRGLRNPAGNEFSQVVSVNAVFETQSRGHFTPGKLAFSKSRTPSQNRALEGILLICSKCVREFLSYPPSTPCSSPCPRRRTFGCSDCGPFLRLERFREDQSRYAAR
jgi:hypothetical protein